MLTIVHSSPSYKNEMPMATGYVIGKMINELCEVQFIDVFDNYSVGVITKPKSGAPLIRDRVVTK